MALATAPKQWLPLVFSLFFGMTTSFVLPYGVPSQSSSNRLQQFGAGSTFSSLRMSHAQDGDTSESLRRRLLVSLPFTTLLSNALPAKASLVQFPCKSLMNTYHFMRAGESLLEEQDIWSTNPLFLTNRESALSERGMEQVHEACRFMEQHDLMPSVVKFSLAANSMDTADIISMELQVGRNRLVPEYTYMDQRGIGRWEGFPLQSTQDAVWAMDEKEAGREGTGGKPPPHEDGTPNETLGNQVIRLRQLISLLESSLSGDDILLVFPDGTGPALLSCLIGGIPLHRVHELDYRPGEVRLDITYSSVRAMLPAAPSSKYLDSIQRGKKQLAVLRAQDPQQVQNVKEQRHEAEMLAAKQQEEALAKAKKQLELEKQRVLQARREQVEAAKRERMQLEETKRQRKREEASAARREQQGGTPDFVSVGALGLVSAASLVMSGNSDVPRDGEALKEEMQNQEQIDAMPLNETIAETPATPSLLTESDVSQLEQTSLTSTATSETTSDLVSTNPELRAMEELIEEAPIDIPEFHQQAPTMDERLEMAERAMQDYLDLDDGGDAWLGVMSEIIAEEDE